MLTSQQQRSSESKLSNLQTAVVKVTHRCNLKCAYCYEHITGGPDMSMDTFKMLADVSVGQTSSRTFAFLFHGGEPTLMSPAWFGEAIDYADSIGTQRDIAIRYNMQSNLARLDEDMTQLFVDRGISIGVSLDGPPSLNDQSRGAGERVCQNFLALKAAGVPAGVLTTINFANWNSMPAIIDYLQNELGERTFKANVSYPVGVGRNLPPLTGEQIITAQKAIMDHMLETQGRGIIEDNLAEAVLRFDERTQPGLRRSTLCHDHVCGAGERVVGVTPAGDLLPCGRFEWNDRDWKLADVWSVGDQEGRQNWRPRMQTFWSIALHNWQECAKCDAKNICAYSCQAFIVRSQEKKNLECEPTKWLYAYLTHREVEVTTLATTIRQRSHSPSSHYDDADYSDAEKYSDKSSPYSDHQYIDYSDDGKYSDNYGDKSN